MSPTSGRLVLRPLAGADRAQLAALWVAAWRATFPDIDFDARRPWLADHLAKLEAAGVRIVCAFEGEAMRGFVTIDPATHWLDQLCVHPDAFGAGVAQALLEAARRASPERIGLDVNADNVRALRFYEREGFARIGAGVNPMSGRRTLKLEWRR